MSRFPTVSETPKRRRRSERRLVNALPAFVRREEFEDLKKSNLALRRTNAELEMLYAVSIGLTSTLNLDSLFQLVLGRLTEGLKYDRAFIMLYDAERHILHNGRVRGATPKVKKALQNLEIPVDLHYRVLEQVVGKRRSYVANPDDVRRASGHERELVDFLQTKALAVVPLISQKRLLGVLWVDLLREARDIEPREVRLLTQIASQVAVAIDHAQAYETITDLNARLEAKVMERTRDLERTGMKLKDAFRTLKELDDFKNKFFAHISHELRTPLTLLLAPLDLLLESQTLGPGERRTLQTVRANAKQLMKMINALLELSKVRSGKMQLRFQSVDLGDLLRAVIERVAPLAASCGIRLNLEAPPGCEIYLDREQFVIIMQNLLANALNFTEEGGVVEVIVKSCDATVQIEVRDTGRGIPDADLPYIFERFVHGHGGRTQGTGIGLALAKELVELHGGALRARSIVGSGTVMSLEMRMGKEHLRPEWVVEDGMPEIPFDVIASPETFDMLNPLDHHDIEDLAPLPAREGNDHWKILVVEDHPEMRAYLKHVLSERYTVVTAARGEQGLEVAQAQQPDLVLTDVSMAGMNGYELCQALKRDPATRAVPVIVLTAHVDPDETVKALEHFGADDYIPKPFHPRELLARVERFLRLREMQAQLLHVEKLASLGQLSAGLAHEINNPLGFIKSGLASLRKNLAVDQREQVQFVIESMEEGIDRIRNLVRDLRDYSRGDGGHLQQINIKREIDLCLQILSTKIREKKIDVSVDVGPQEVIYAHGSQVGQVLMNLLHNAVQAVPQAGTINVELRRVDGEVLISVKDSGPGIRGEHLRRIFNPFFTTKAPGEGLGLGLSICEQIVRGHGGRIWVESEEGAGTIFFVALPQSTVCDLEKP